VYLLLDSAAGVALKLDQVVKLGPIEAQEPLAAS